MTQRSRRPPRPRTPTSFLLGAVLVPVLLATGTPQPAVALTGPPSVTTTSSAGDVVRRAGRPAWARLTLTTANVRGYPAMRQARVQADLDRLRRIGGSAILQEITPPRYKRAVARTFPRQGISQLDHSIPIALGRSWRAGTSGVRRMHEGRGDISPDRYVTWQHVSQVRRGRTIRFVLLNTHFVSEGFNRRPDRGDAWRRRMWRLHFERMRLLVDSFTDRGLTVIGGGDFNRRESRGLRRFSPTQRWLYSDAGVDKLFVVPAPGGARVALKDTWSTRGFSDHASRTAALRIGPPRRS